MTFYRYMLIVERTCSAAAIKESAFALHDWWKIGIAPEMAAEWAERRLRFEVKQKTP